MMLATNLYSDLLTRLVGLINRSIQPYDVHSAAIILLDSPGLQNFASIGNNDLQ